MKPLAFSFENTVTEVHLERAFRLPRAEHASARLYVFDANTSTLFGRNARPQAEIGTGEPNKSWESASVIQTAALENELTRGSTMVGIGGGLVCDVTAFCASIYMRGCGLVLVPTTLLAMVDAAVGGKTGINYLGYKNIVGSFYPARTVYVFAETLATLPEREYRSGLAEVIKTALIGDRTLYVLLERERSGIEKRDPDLLRDIIGRCIAVKGKIVERDPREDGVRAHLNLGHTFAHALESAAGLARWTHGEAVAWGMARAMDLGCRLGITDRAYADGVKALLVSYGFQIEKVGIDPQVITSAMRKDKKRRHAALRFVLQRDLCVTVVEEVEESAARAAID